MEAKNIFWEVTIEITEEVDNGKFKKKKEVDLVDAADVTEVENKVNKEFDGMMSDYKIKSIKRSNILLVY